MKIKNVVNYLMDENALGIIIILIFIIIFMLIVSPAFRSPNTFNNLLLRMVPIFLMGLGQAFVILIGGIDISVGTIMSLGNVIAASFIKEWSYVGIGLAILAGAFVGFANGVGVVKLKINPFLMTFCSMNILIGISIWILPYPGGFVPYNFAKVLMYSIGYIPVGPLLLFFIICTISFILLKNTSFGFSLYAVGGNPESSSLAGINVPRIKIISYSISGLMSAIAGVYFSARMLSGDAHIGDTFMMDSIMVATVGGISLEGGQGGIIGVVAGACLIAILDNAFNLLGFSTYLKLISKGAILVFCVLLSNYQKNSRRNKRG